MPLSSWARDVGSEVLTEVRHYLQLCMGKHNIIVFPQHKPGRISPTKGCLAYTF